MSQVKLKSCFCCLLGSAILAFGLYNIHSISCVTEGGILGLTLLIQHWLGISPALSSFVLDGVCYIWAWRLLGMEFAIYSVVSCCGFSVFYAIFEQFGHIWPNIGDNPAAAAITGAFFVGLGAGLAVREGGAPGGDDALAMGVSHLMHVRIEWVYLISDATVLLLSLSYIPIERIIYSFITVVISGKIVGLVVRAGRVSKEKSRLEQKL